MAARKPIAKPAATKKAAPKAAAAKKAVRRPWTKEDIRELKAQARKKVSATEIAKALKRSEGATRQKAFSERISLNSRR